MKKYFLKGMDEPLENGDIIEFDIMKKGSDGQAITRHIQCQFLPGLIPLLLEEDVIEEKEAKESSKQPVETESKDEEGPKDEEGDLDEFIDKTTEFVHRTTEFIPEITNTLHRLNRRVEALEEQLEKHSRKYCTPFGGCFFIF